ncbi:hypothetical protein, partial [Nocardia sp. NPDC004604]|uniref:hypothetical protein n=1 Tax=Nocardia sp. NPDC004604 TaxID=3157013 RepID=UPI0033AAD9A1
IAMRLESSRQQVLCVHRSPFVLGIRQVDRVPGTAVPIVRSLRSLISASPVTTGSRTSLSR